MAEPQIDLDNPPILIVDDLPSNTDVIVAMLEAAGFDNVLCINDARATLEAFREFRPDLILLDLHMPHLNGLDVIEQLKPEIGNEYIPILMLTADATSEAKEHALSVGAKDFLSKPFDHTEVVLRIRNLLETRGLYKQLQRQKETLEEKVEERTGQLEFAKIELLERLALAAEIRDDETGHHTQRVGRVSALIAQALGLGDRSVELIRRAAPLHDIGKIATPDSILLKPGKLSSTEWRVMKRHTKVGARLLSNSIASSLQLAETIALTHHEHWDGNGYTGLAGTDIPAVGRLVAVVDVFDALTNRRPYKEAWELDRAVDEIKSQRGLQFEPRIVDAFLEVHSTVDLLEPEEIPQHLVVDLSEALSVAGSNDVLTEPSAN
jgi:putative two-component system response regulator